MLTAKQIMKLNWLNNKRILQYQKDSVEYPSKLKAYEDEQAVIKAALAELEKYKNERWELIKPSAQSLVLRF